MKKNIKFIIPFLFIVVLGFVVYKIADKINHKKEVAENIKQIPNFSYEKNNGTLFTNKDLKKEIPVIFVYFNTECEFCNEEANMIKENIDKFKNTQILFISFEDKAIINSFASQHKLLEYDNVYFLCDSKTSFASTFDVNSLPCLVLYDKNQQLIEKIKGQIKAEVLIKKLNLE